jgi:hypothetical protein
VKTVQNDGPCRIDSVFIGEVTIDALQPSVQVVAKYGLANEESGDRFGSGNRNVWGPKTLELVQQLLDSMESDILSTMFKGYQEEATTGGVDQEITTSGGVPGF